MKANPIRNTFGGVVKQTALSRFYELSLFDRLLAFIRAVLLGEPIQVGNRPVLMAPSGRMIVMIAGGDGTEDFVKAVKAMAEGEDAEVTAEEVAAIEQLTRIADLTDEELAELEPVLRALADKVKDDDTDEAIAMLTSIGDQIDVVRAEVTTRETAAEERATKREEALARINPPEAAADDDEEDKETDTTEPEPAADEKADPPNADGEEDKEPETEPKAGDEEKEPVTAATRPAPGAAMKGKKPAVKKTVTPKAALVAGADLRSHTAGAPIATLEELADEYFLKAEAMSGLGKPGRAVVASIDIRQSFPDELKLGHDPIANSEKIAKVLAERKAIVAAGGICGPLEARYEIENISTDARPLRDALPRFQAPRGGVRFVPPPRLTDVDGAVGIWTDADDIQASSDENKKKPILVIDCAEEDTVKIYGVTSRARFGNFLARFSPERFRSMWEKVGALAARTAEDELWDAMVSASTPVGTGQGLGTARDVLAAIGRASAYFRNRHRMPETATLRLYAPTLLKSNIREDLARQLPGDNTLAVADAEIDRFFAARNVNVDWLLDARQEIGPETGLALDGWASTYQVILSHEGAFGFLDGGTLDLGVEIRDSSLNAQNNVEAFTESFEAVAFWGEESLVIDLDVCPSGKVAGTVSFDPCSTGS